MGFDNPIPLKASQTQGLGVCHHGLAELLLDSFDDRDDPPLVAGHVEPIDVGKLAQERRGEIVACFGRKGPDLPLRKILYVVEVFVPARRLLIDLEMSQIDDVDFDSVQFIDNSRGEALLKNNSRNRRGDLNPDRRYAHANDLALFLEEFSR